MRALANQWSILITIPWQPHRQPPNSGSTCLSEFDWLLVFLKIVLICTLWLGISEVRRFWIAKLLSLSSINVSESPRTTAVGVSDQEGVQRIMEQVCIFTGWGAMTGKLLPLLTSHEHCTSIGINFLMVMSKEYSDFFEWIEGLIK